MRANPEDNVLLRVYVGESDQHGGQPLYREIVMLLRREGIAGATAIRAEMGYGEHSVLHTAHILRLSTDLPVIVEAVDSGENINRVLPLIDELMKGGLVTVEKVTAYRYPTRAKEEH